MFLVLIYLAFISLGLPDSVLGSSWPIMNAEFGVPSENVGFVSIIISIGTIISSLFSHHLIKRFGTGKVTLVSVAMTALALLGFSFAPSFEWLLVCAVPLGLGAGAVDSGLNEFVAEHYSAKHMNWLHCFWGVGTMLGPLILSTLTRTGQTWRSGYFSISIIQFALVILLLFFLPMWKKYENLSVENIEKESKKEKNNSFSSLQVKYAVLTLITFFLYSAIEATMTLWGSSYLVETKSVVPESAAGWISVFFLGITVGRLLSGFVSVKLSNENLIRSGAILAITGLFIMALPLPAAFTIFAYIIIGIGLAPIYPSMLHQTPVYFGKENSQAAMGLQMAFAYTGTTLMPPLLGQLFSRVSFSLMPYLLLVCGLGLLISSSRLASLRKQALISESKLELNVDNA